jgi:hypothetical protein
MGVKLTGWTILFSSKEAYNNEPWSLLEFAPYTLVALHVYTQKGEAKTTHFAAYKSEVGIFILLWFPVVHKEAL